MNNELYFTYLDDFPNIPNDILPSVEEVVAAPHWSNGEKFESMRHPWAKANYHRKKVSPQLKEWLLKNMPFECRFAAGFNVFNTLMKPHRDIRDETYNFILDAGGEIYTEWYNKQEEGQSLLTWDSIRNDTNDGIFVKPTDIITLGSVLIEPLRWHKIKTDAVHGTKGTQTHPRIILSVITQDMIKTPSNPTLAEAINNWFSEW